MSTSLITALLFDLDGTVINSVAGIQNAFNYAYKKIYHNDMSFNLGALIGPSIKDIFVTLTGEKDANLINSFVNYFQERYDTIDYKKTKLYPGMAKLLKGLTLNSNLQVFIATNKRTIPTMLILNHLQIKFFFKNIYCLDSNDPVFFNKSEMVKQILINENLDAQNTLFVGDTIHDKVAAEDNGIKFIYASYGFGELNNPENVISHSSQIINYLN